MSVCFIPPYTPLLYSKTGVYRGIHYFLIFEQKYENNNKNQRKIVIFTAVKNHCILHGRVFLMN